MKILPITMEDTQNKLTVHAMGYVMDTIPKLILIAGVQL